MTLQISQVPTNLLIGGEWCEGSSGKRIPVYNPSNGEVLASVADATLDDARKAIDAAEQAAAGWRATAPRERGEILRRCFDLMQRDKEKLARLISLENGKALKDARGEVAYAAEFFRWFSEEAVRVNGDVSVAPGGASRILVQYEPMGIAMLVTPWNFPAAMATRKIAPALAAGCTCILKPATETPLTAFVMGEILAEAGVPAGVVNILTTSSSGKTVSSILHDPRVRKLSFTGSTEVGRILLREAADTVVHCSMELGGNAPVLVFDDADLDKAIEGVMLAKMRNGGEACTAANRIYVQDKIYDAFVERLGQRMEALTLDEAAKESTDCGPLVNAQAVETVGGLVKDAVSKGARVVTGGKQVTQPGHYYQPTVLAEIPENALLLQEEIFGPVAPVIRFQDEDAAIRSANDTEYGLVAYVFTEDFRRALRVSERLEAGMIAINRGIVSDPAAPFGGVKQSGLGREGAHHGILEFMEAKYISAEW
ncbi:NAD-dependent succinate-semialdehyde dehydrogenase [Nitratireductor sp.]|uniref:NAD-dependent succinate-semialdehyde dehydrogenase n=1 Tax=Nitratireductor sp. TaxID=1872084 RepID=UPI0025D8A6E5|nr:NAD-dependent succinate-semialdehyde dehydrogenase [Nitratireductor sp.]